VLLGACSRGSSAAVSDAGADAAVPWTLPSAEPEPRPGMVWIPGGVLIAGTPPDKLPRVADEEMAGEQVVMRGFYVDAYPYPNEPGAIPTTGLSKADAEALCTEQGKRLCTELELERACKGPTNTIYEYGDVYKESACGTGARRTLVPNGVHTGCQSAFGVHDLHGGVWTWTASAWGRGGKPGLVALRGGNSDFGELVGRCANGRALAPESPRPDVGVRCCAGEPNSFQVVLDVVRGEPLKWRAPDHTLAPVLLALVPEELANAAAGRRAEDHFTIERMWIWHPLGNEELVVGGGCAHPGGHARCGVVVARVKSMEKPVSLAFVSSDWWQPTLAESDSPREVFLHGGDRNGAFRVKVSYDWGRIGLGPKERKKKHKGRREPSYD
jgi:hypothetical protein